MKKGLLYLGIMAVCMVFSINTLKAQTEATEANGSVTYTIPEMKALAITGEAPSLTFKQTSGAAIVAETDESRWLNYTSIVALNATNKITVKLTGTVPAGTTLTVEAADASTGDGSKGGTAGEVTLDDTDAHDLITGIGSCYTGNATSEGAQLTYTWSVNSTGYGDLRAASNETIGITYTIVGE